MDPTKKRKIDGNGTVKVEPGLQSPHANQMVFNSLMLTLDDTRQIVEPFTHDQLLEIVQNALLRHPDVLDAVRSIADRDVAQRKLFIRGLGWETTTEKLRELFSVYGILDEAVVILDKVTGQSKGFGFITFKHVDGAIMALKVPSKKIDGRMTVTRLAAAGKSGDAAEGGAGGPKNSLDVSTRKIFVSNVPYEMSSERLLQHFSMYGEVEEGPLGFNKTTGNSKGFALFVYKTAEAARASLVDPVKNVDGHQLSCKMAVEGKKGKPPGAGAAGPTGLQGVNQGNGYGIEATKPSGQFGGGPGGISGHYGGYSGSLGGPGAGLSAIGNQTAGSSFGAGGPYGGGSHFGGHIGTGYGGMGGHGGGLGSGTGLANGAGRGSSMYGYPPSSSGMGSGDYLQGAQYGLSSGGYPGQHAPRVPPGGAYQGMPPYY